MSNLDDIRLHELFDIYSSLLTEKQKNVFELYYFEDLSLAEIAEELEVSRNAIYNNIQATIRHLQHFEDNLHISKMKQELRELCLNKTKLVEDDLEKILTIIEEI